MDFRKASDAHANVSFMDDICRLRNMECDKVFHSMSCESHTEGASKKTKKYIRKARASDAAVLPGFVNVVLPDVLCKDGQVIGGFVVRMLVEGIRSSVLFVEMTSEVMNYIHTAVMNSEIKGRHWHRRTEQGIEEARSRSHSPNTEGQEFLMSSD